MNPNSSRRPTITSYAPPGRESTTDPVRVGNRVSDNRRTRGDRPRGSTMAVDHEPAEPRITGDQPPKTDPGKRQPGRPGVARINPPSRRLPEPRTTAHRPPTTGDQPATAPSSVSHQNRKPPRQPGIDPACAKPEPTVETHPRKHAQPRSTRERHEPQTPHQAVHRRTRTGIMATVNGVGPDKQHDQAESNRVKC